MLKILENIAAFFKRYNINYCNSYKDRIEIAIFIEYSLLYEEKMKQLAADGDDQNEISETMLLSEDFLILRSKLSIYQHFVDTNHYKELKIDNISKNALSTMFFERLDYADSHKRIYIALRQTKYSLIRKYIKNFGKPPNISEMILKAEIIGDTELVKAFK